MIHPATTLYRLTEVRDGHLILRAPNGALRVVSSRGLQPGRLTPLGVCVTTPQAQYLVPAEDYRRIKPLLAAASA